MPKVRLAGIKVSSSEVQVVVLTYEAKAFTLIEAQSLKLQTGARSSAYHVLHQQMVGFLRERKIDCACIKGSAVSLGGTKKAHLEGAEGRGVILAAAGSVCDVRVVSKAAVSRTFGDRKVDQYLSDDSFWGGLGLDEVKKGMREAAFAAISQYHET